VLFVFLCFYFALKYVGLTCLNNTKEENFTRLRRSILEVFPLMDIDKTAKKFIAPLRIYENVISNEKLAKVNIKTIIATHTCKQTNIPNIARKKNNFLNSLFRKRQYARHLKLIRKETLYSIKS
jgi:hypothetical protein